MLNDEEQHALLSKSKIVKYKPGAVIYAEGDSPSCLLFLNSGKVKICKKGVSGKNQIIRLIKTGWFFGYRALLAEDENYRSTAQVFEEAEIVEIAQDLINDLIYENHRLSNLFIHILASDLAKSNETHLITYAKASSGALSKCLIDLGRYLWLRP